MNRKHEKLICQMVQWAEQEARDSIKWLEARRPITDMEKEAYTAGVKQGYSKCLGSLKMHGFLNV